jgi:hypothetical protein
MLRRPLRNRAFVFHVRAVASASEKSRIDQRAEYCVARWLIKPPEAPRLLGGQPEAGHFKVFATNATDNLMHAAMCFGHNSPRFEYEVFDSHPVPASGSDDLWRTQSRRERFVIELFG